MTVCSWSPAPVRKLSSNLAQPAINTAVAWGSANGLRFSTSKTQAILFTRCKNLEVRNRLVMNGEPIPLVKRGKIPRGHAHQSAEMGRAHQGQDQQGEGQVGLVKDGNGDTVGAVPQDDDLGCITRSSSRQLPMRPSSGGTLSFPG